ncbi:glycosyltransferase family 4 protein [Limimaricola pyoseonensis]|uniref:Glycosyltransferase involved in cell wall bisynthesis n=1 Tax=Limimaricola pyoseonensis TaxID=521013 RepID=A0A1G7IVE7_9RHOB|nr:glycosyltransferase family 4 protein [Limimaricola pyoseonensis]SDF16651.1 Glycosyltransferase involved in cell wall bisynthesis [Limimaricola pyoseonensis]
MTALERALPTPHLDAARAGRPMAGRRVLIIVENLPLPFDRRVWQECLTLRAAGAEVAVICPKGRGFEAPYERIEGVHIYRHPLPFEARGAAGYLLEYGAALWHEARLALKVLRRHGFDTIQACNPPDLIFLVAWPFKLLGKRFVFDHHDIMPELFEAKFGKRGWLWRLTRAFERLTFRAADVVISTNESYREIARARGGKRASEVFVVRSGPDLNRLRRVAPNRAWARGRDHLIGYVGVMGAQEGIDLLLEAMRLLVHERGLSVQLVLVGGGPERAALEALSARLGLEDHVTFTGRAPDEVLFEVLSSADLCVNPDRVNPMNDKSTMNKIMEYMAFGQPIVQFEVTEGRVSAGPASLYARPNDAADMAAQIARLLADPALRARMGRAGRTRVVRDLGWDGQVPALLAAYAAAAPAPDAAVQPSGKNCSGTA